jgi:uncharacterized membrane protein
MGKWWLRIMAVVEGPQPERSYNANEIILARLAVIFLSVEWMIFGSMHFVFPAATEAQLPSFIVARHDVVILSGIIEVAIGCLILVSRTRRLSAMISLALLIIYIMPVYTILSAPNETILPVEALAIVFKLGIIPNNIWLGLCSIFLLEHNGIRLTAPLKQERAGRGRLAIPQSSILLVAIIFFACNSAGFLAVWLNATRAVGEGSMWALACLSMGALLGFLFGIPKFNRATRSRDALLPNTNIEEVSDWITKIIVGIGLVNFTDIAAYVRTSSIRMGQSMHITDTFATALIAYFTTLGLIEGYVLTRMFLAREFMADGQGTARDHSLKPIA